MRVQFVIQEIWIGLRRNLTMTISLILTVAIAMALFGTGLLVQQQVSSAKGYWHDKIEVSIFLCAKTSTNPHCNDSEATQEQKDRLRAELESMDQIRSIEYESKEEAFERFKDRFATTPGLTQSTKPGDIPDSFRVRLVDPQEYESVTQQLASAEGVDQVINERDILDRFFGILNGLQWAAFFIALIQVIAAVLLVGNTVRLSAFNRRRETGIMRLVGASNTYIQLPFILEGAIAGAIGGLISAVLLVISKLALIDRLQNNIQFSVVEMPWSTVFFVIVFSLTTGVLLCAVASFLTLRRYLRI